MFPVFGPLISVFVSLFPVFVPIVSLFASLFPAFGPTVCAGVSLLRVSVCVSLFPVVPFVSVRVSLLLVVATPDGSTRPAADWGSAFPETPRVVSFLSYILSQKGFLHKFAVENCHGRYQTSKPVFTKYQA
jgi:hypothetical protein